MTEQLLFDFYDEDLGEFEIQDDQDDVLIFTNEKPSNSTLSFFGDNKRIDVYHNPEVYPAGFKSDNHAMFILMLSLASYANDDTPISFPIEDVTGFRFEVHDLTEKPRAEVEIE